MPRHYDIEEEEFDEGPDEADIEASQAEDEEENEEYICPSCGRGVHEETQRCPHCGDWIMPANPRAQNRSTIYILIIVLATLALLAWALF